MAPSKKSAAAPPDEPAVQGSASTASSGSTAGGAGFAFHPASVFVDGLPLPRLFVFDLDYTLWPFWVDTHVTPPLKAAPTPPAGGSGSGSHSNGRPRNLLGAAAASAVLDRHGESYGFYADVPALLQALPAAGVRVGVASRTSAPDLARDMLRLLQVPPIAAEGAGAPAPDGTGAGTGLFKKGRKPAKAIRAIDAFDAGLEIYPSTKLRHMEALQRRTGLAYEDFLFFDDESRNRNVESLGVTMWLVRDGVSWPEVERGVREWRRRRGHVPPASGRQDRA